MSPLKTDRARKHGLSEFQHISTEVESVVDVVLLLSVVLQSPLGAAAILPAGMPVEIGDVGTIVMVLPDGSCNVR